MKAAIRRKYCNPEGLAIESIPTPEPAPDQVLIKIHATTVSRTDCGVLTGLPHIFRLFIGLLSPRKIITGTDLTGEVVQAGSAIEKFCVGDKVWAFYDEGLCSHAQYVCLKESDNLDMMPDEMTYEEAVACMEGAHYAINFLDKVKLEQGQSVVINGATGAIGTALVQLLNNGGFKVTAVCAAKHNSLVQSLGADATIDYTVDDVFDRAEKFDFVFDTIGNHSYGRWKKLLTDKGTFVSTELGPYCQFLFFAISTTFFFSKKVIFPLPTDIMNSMRIVRQLIAEGKFRAVIDKTYPLDEIGDAFRYVIEGFKTGNVVVRIM